MGVQSAQDGEDTRWNWQTDGWLASLPRWILVIAVIAVIVGVILVYRRDAKTASFRRRWSLVLLRLAALAMVLLLLLQLTLSIDRTGLPTLVVMIDDSASMQFQDVFTGTDDQPVVEDLLGSRDAADRLELTQTLLTRDRGLLEQLSRNYQLRIYRFAGEATPLQIPDQSKQIADALTAVAELEATGQQTAPLACVRQVTDKFRGASPTAMVIFTDGISSMGVENALSQLSKNQSGRSAPLYIVATGSEQSARDLELTDVRVDEVAIVNESVLFTGELRAEGFEGREVVLEIRNAATDERLRAKMVNVTEATQQVELDFVPEAPGEFDYSFRVVPLEEEQVTENNFETRHVSVREGRIRVLLVDNLPRYEFRYVKHLLERNETGSGGIELHTIVLDADADWAALDSSAAELQGRLPATADKLNAYDVVILGDVDPELIGIATQRLLRTFVREQGGGLVLIAGAKHNPHSYRGTELEPLVPTALSQVTSANFRSMTRGGVRTKPSLAGRRGTGLFRFGENETETSRVISEFPELYSLLQLPWADAGANVLATVAGEDGTDRPLIIGQRYGAGNVILHATDDLWMWRYRSGDETYGRYWTALIRYLSRSSLLGRDRTAELITDRETYESGEDVAVQLRFTDSRAQPADRRATINIERKNGASRVVELVPSIAVPDTYEGKLVAPEVGSYHVWVSKPTFEQSPPTADFRVEGSSRELQERRMDVAGMKAAAKSTRGRYYTFSTVNRLPAELPAGRQTAIERGKPIALWSRLEPLLLIVALLALEWFLRKNARLI